MRRNVGRAIGKGISPVVEGLDINEIVHQIDLQALLEQVDLDEVLSRVDMNRILMTQFGPSRLRAVTHMDVDEAGIRRTARVFADCPR